MKNFRWSFIAVFFKSWGLVKILHSFLTSFMQWLNIQIKKTRNNYKKLLILLTRNFDFLFRRFQTEINDFAFCSIKNPIHLRQFKQKISLFFSRKMIYV